MLINDLDADVAEQAAGEIDGETAVFAADLTEEDVPDQLVAKAVEEFGQVDILVNNAGYTCDAVLHKMSDEQFQAMLDIHTIVPFRLCRALAPHWREAAKQELGEGKEVFRKIVNVTSISGTMGNAGQANYSVGEGRGRRPDEDARQGMGRRSRSTSTRSPSASSRPGSRRPRRRARRSRSGGEQVELGIPEQTRSMAAMIIPLGRPAQPEEAAKPVLFLCSELSNYVHGQVLNVTGGQFGGMYI